MGRKESTMYELTWMKESSKLIFSKSAVLVLINNLEFSYISLQLLLEGDLSVVVINGVSIWKVMIAW